MYDLHLDFETYCDLDLKKVGVANYVAHPSFRVMAVAWSIASFKCSMAVPPGMALPPDLILALRQTDVQGHAWNAAFETAVLMACGFTPTNPLICTMQRAMAYGLPGKLDAAGRALGLTVTKNMAGYRLMLQMSRPLKEKASPWTAADYALLVDYCADDVASEKAISEVIPPLIGQELELSWIDGAMNRTGFVIDRHRVRLLMGAAEAAEKIDAARCAVITGGAVTSPGTQTDRLKKWLTENGVAVTGVGKDVIVDTLASAEDFNPDVGEVLQIRLRTAKGSVKKLKRMLDMSSHMDGVIRHQFQFCGAGRTGRWSGRGIQPQNLPRIPKGFSPDRFARLATGGDGLDVVSPAPVLDCVSWSLRSCLTGPGELIWGFDFSQIEARVLAWLAGQTDVLDVFRDPSQDIYVWAAEQFGSTNRQLGKVLILALGFGMGATKLRETARKNYGVTLSGMEADRFKTDWRNRNRNIVRFWYDMEAAARGAILRPGTVIPVGRSGVCFTCTARTLQMRLPSGRVLYYHKPGIGLGGEISYWGVELGQWAKQKTYGGKLAENATQAAARDIMAEAMLRMATVEDGMVPLMTVHDELVYPLEAFTLSDANSAGLKSVCDLWECIMLESPAWSGGLPIAGEAKIMSRYGVTL